MQKNILNIYFEKITIRNQPDFLTVLVLPSHTVTSRGFRTVVAAIYWPQLAKLESVKMAKLDNLSFILHVKINCKCNKKIKDHVKESKDSQIYL